MKLDASTSNIYQHSYQIFKCNCLMNMFY